MDEAVHKGALASPRPGTAVRIIQLTGHVNPPAVASNRPRHQTQKHKFSQSCWDRCCRNPQHCELVSQGPRQATHTVPHLSPRCPCIQYGLLWWHELFILCRFLQTAAHRTIHNSLHNSLLFFMVSPSEIPTTQDFKRSSWQSSLLHFVHSNITVHSLSHHETQPRSLASPVPFGGRCPPAPPHAPKDGDGQWQCYQAQLRVFYMNWPTWSAWRLSKAAAGSKQRNKGPRDSHS